MKIRLLAGIFFYYGALSACQDTPRLPTPHNAQTINPESDFTTQVGGRVETDRLRGGSEGGDISSAGMIAGDPAGPLAGQEIEMDIPSMGGTLSVVGGQMMPEGGQMTPEGGQMTPEVDDETYIDLPESCQGPLELPMPDCRPDPLPSTGDLYKDCVRRVNQLRAVCQCLPSLERWRDGESCANEHAEYDAMTGQAHSGFRDGICSPQGRGQNECPGYRSEDQVISLCLQQMWDEGPGEPFIEHGHYINMTNPSHQRVACGFFTTTQGRVWAIQNFSP